MSKRKSSKISQGSGSTSDKEGPENQYHKEVMELKESISPATCWSNLYNCAENEAEDQMSTYVRLDVIGSALCERFAWAIPDNKALRIISTFSKKIIEIGCGKGYWLSLLQKSMGMESCVGVDKYSIEDPHIATVIKGTPSILQNKKYKDHTLLLCYPDQGEDVSTQCLDYYEGDIIIHIGELCMTHNSTKAMGAQAPFGRTTTSEFQVSLMAEWHMLLSYKLESFPFANDYLTVWKRIIPMPGLSNGLDTEEGEQEENEGEEEDQEEDQEGEDMWKGIPSDELLPAMNIACDKYKHLLE